MQRIVFATTILLIFLSISCATTAVKTPPPESSILEAALQKIKEDSPEIQKYFTLDETGNIIVQGTLEYFQVLYDLKNIRIESTGSYIVPFTVTYLETGAVQKDTLLWKPQKDGTGILLSFDDNFFDVWERYFELFDRYDVRVTFFVLGTYSAFSSAALKRGHDIGYHSLQHFELHKVSRSLFYAETISQTASFRNAGVPLTAFAYPFGFYEPWMHEELLKTYRLLRGFNTSFQVYDAKTIQNGIVFSRSIDNVLFTKDDNFTALVDIMLRTLKFIGQNLILPLTSHNISDTDNWGIKPHRLEYLLQTARDLQLHFYRYGDFFQPPN